MHIELPDYLGKLIENDIDITVESDQEHGYRLNLNLKSQFNLDLAKKDGQWVAIDIRNRTTDKIDSYHDLLETVYSKVRVCTFMHESWRILLEKEGFSLDESIK